MNDEAARQGRPITASNCCPNCNDEGGYPVLEFYGGERAVRCPECGTRTPSRLHLDRHLLRQCCGLVGRAA